MGLHHPGDGRLGFAAANIRGKCADVLVPEFLLDVRPWSSGVIQSVKP